MSGRLRVIVRQAWRNLRARPGQALLILLATCLATTTLSMAIAVNKTGDDAWNRVWRASRGADVAASAGYAATAIPADASPTWAYQQLNRLKQTPGIAATAGPWSDLKTQGQIGAATVALSVQARDPQPAALDQPIIASGTWLDQREGVVLEDGLATILHVRAADTVTIAGRRLVVLGTALAVSAPRYRPSHIGYAWVDRRTGALLQSAGAKFQTAVMPIRLRNPTTAVQFAAHFTGRPDNPDPGAFVELIAASTHRDTSHDDLNTLAIALGVIGTILSILMVAIATVLISAPGRRPHPPDRRAESHRRHARPSRWDGAR